jgi:hypothetical protein
MKKLTTLLAADAMCFGSVAHDDNMGKKPPVTQANDDFAWGIALVGLAVIGTVVGLTASSASSTPASYSTN